MQTPDLSNVYELLARLKATVADEELKFQQDTKTMPPGGDEVRLRYGEYFATVKPVHDQINWCVNAITRVQAMQPITFIVDGASITSSKAPS